MRYIQIDTFTPSKKWQLSADKATAELLRKPTLEAKLAYIKKNSDVWKKLGKEFGDYFGNKCWYTDAPNYVARLDVEHFRPKAMTVELSLNDCREASEDLLLKLREPKREGYWWLAFDFENLLLCAQVMNREGKRNFFPLHKDSIVASGTNRDTLREIPAFLDPRKLSDVVLVTYDETGAMRPRGDIDGWDRLRVVMTNELFGLSKFQPLTEGRQLVWQKCTSLIDQYLKAAARQRQMDRPDPLLEQKKIHALQELHKLVDPHEPFSSVAASCLLNSPYEWARALASRSHYKALQN